MKTVISRDGTRIAYVRRGSGPVGFFAGADFDSPPPNGEGRYRYVKLRSVDEVDDRLEAWIANAVRVDGWK